MSTASEIQAAARAIRVNTGQSATFHRAVADLLDHIALTAPKSSPSARYGLSVARAYLHPGTRPQAVES